MPLHDFRLESLSAQEPGKNDLVDSRDFGRCLEILDAVPPPALPELSRFFLVLGRAAVDPKKVTLPTIAIILQLLPIDSKKIFCWFQFRIPKWENYYDVLPLFRNRHPDLTDFFRHCYATTQRVYHLGKDLGLRVRVSDLAGTDRRLELLDEFLETLVAERAGLEIGQEVKRCGDISKWLRIDFNTVLIKVRAVFGHL